MLEVRQIEPQEKPKGTVLLGHAMFNSMSYFFSPARSSLADQIVEAGYRVVAFNLTGYGKSEAARIDTDFDSYVADYEKVIANLPADCRLHYIGHSVGSLAGISAIASGSRAFDTITMVCPAIWGHTSSAYLLAAAQKAQLQAATLAATLIGRVPAARLRLGNTDAPLGYIRQLMAWASAGSVTANSGTSYTGSWANMAGKIFVLEAAHDPWMAPPANISWIMSHLPKPAVRICVDSALAGFETKHFSIIYGRAAKNSVWPFLLKNLET